VSVIIDVVMVILMNVVLLVGWKMSQRNGIDVGHFFIENLLEVYPKAHFTKTTTCTTTLTISQTSDRNRRRILPREKMAFITQSEKALRKSFSTGCGPPFLLMFLL